MRSTLSLSGVPSPTPKIFCSDDGIWKQTKACTTILHCKSVHLIIRQMVSINIHNIADHNWALRNFMHPLELLVVDFKNKIISLIIQPYVGL